jgi:hypothetical protein
MSRDKTPGVITSVGFNIGGTERLEGHNIQREKMSKDKTQRDKVSGGTKSPEGQDIRRQNDLFGIFSLQIHFLKFQNNTEINSF